MKLMSIKKVLKSAIESGWEETVGIQEIVNGTGFKVLKSCGSGVISVTCDDCGVSIRADKYFEKELNKEKKKGEYGHYSFLVDEAEELMKRLKSTYEMKFAIIYNNIILLLQKGRKIYVLNNGRERQATEDREKYITKKIKKCLKNENKKAFWRVN